jgi:hypothetical protein
VSFRAPPPPPDSPLALLGDRRAIVDTGLGPIAFVIANAAFGLRPAAYVAVGLAVLVAAVRLARREPVTNAVGGLLGTGLAVFIALRSGHAIGRPVIGYLLLGFYRLPAEWLKQPGARRACAEVTFAWAGLFALRAVVYAILIPIGSTGALAAASIVMGWPAFGLLLFLSYRYLPRRLSQLGAPLPHGHEPGATPSEPSPSRGATRT